jgi:DNA-binding response OmpR family regulator
MLKMGDGKLVFGEKNLVRREATTRNRNWPLIEADDGAAKLRILIVDDEPPRASDLKRKLTDPTWPVGKLKLEIDVVEDVVNARKFLMRDCIDIYFIDLIMSEKANEGLWSESVGKDFIKEIVENTNAAVIVNSSLPAETEASILLHEGADDYLEKSYDSERVSSRVMSVWRRVLQTRPTKSGAPSPIDLHRTFLLGQWRFVVGSRMMQNIATRETLRITSSEHAFLAYICVVEDHTVDSEILNTVILQRKEYEKFIRMDNFIYRLRTKLDGHIQLTALGETAYRLLNVREIKPSFS